MIFPSVLLFCVSISSCVSNLCLGKTRRTRKLKDEDDDLSKSLIESHWMRSKWTVDTIFNGPRHRVNLDNQMAFRTHPISGVSVVVVIVNNRLNYCTTSRNSFLFFICKTADATAVVNWAATWIVVDYTMAFTYFVRARETIRRAAAAATAASAITENNEKTAKRNIQIESKRNDLFDATSVSINARATRAKNKRQLTENRQHLFNSANTHTRSGFERKLCWCMKREKTRSTEGDRA